VRSLAPLAYGDGRQRLLCKPQAASRKPQATPTTPTVRHSAASRLPTPIVQFACRSLRKRSSPPADDMQHKADDRENNQDVDRGGRNVEEAESRDPGDTKNNSE
jgi:hypothetical protein